MLSLLAFTVLALTALDHWTTYLCLRQPVPGFAIREANPVAAWLFEQLGLLPGLCLDSAVTVAGVAFLLSTPRVPSSAKAFIFLMAGLWTVSAVANNVRAIETLGLL